eukprot:COSAG03_NODE_2870_length_2390_cov_1.941510_3_plen_172_part_00
MALLIAVIETSFICSWMEPCHACSVKLRSLDDNLCAKSTLYATLAAWGMWISVLPQPEWMGDTAWMGNDGKWSITVSFLVLSLGGLIYMLAHWHGEGEIKANGAGDAVWFVVANIPPVLTPLVVALGTTWGWRTFFHLVLVGGAVVILWLSSAAGKAAEPGAESKAPPEHP